MPEVLVLLCAPIAGDSSSPLQVAFDPNGNMLISDYYNYVIRKVSVSGTITTFAGTGKCCTYKGDGVLATSTDLAQTWGVASDSQVRERWCEERERDSCCCECSLTHMIS